MASPSFPTLSAHGAEMPAIGFGTSSLGDCGEIVATALKLGYRHIDTAWKYDTERGVGEGMRASGVPRSDILDRKSTRLNSSHSQISYDVLCLKKKTYHARHAQRPSRQISHQLPLPHQVEQHRQHPQPVPDHLSPFEQTPPAVEHRQQQRRKS